MHDQLRYQNLWRISGWIVVVLAWYVALDPSPPDLSGIQFGDKIVHTLSYLGMMLWLIQCYPRKHQWLLFAFFVLMGIGLEFLQGWSGYRSFEIEDMFANTLGVFIGWLISYTRAGRLFTKIETLVSD